jgi:hypothetical protein
MGTWTHKTHHGPNLGEATTFPHIVGEPTRVVAVEVRGVVLLLEHCLPKENEGPGDGEAVGRLPFAPNVEEGIPSLLGENAFHEAVLGRLLESLVAAFAGGLNPHGLEPGAHW